MTKIKNASLYELIPFNIRTCNIEVASLSYTLQQALSLLCQYADGIEILSQIDSMPNDILDSLAIELNIPCFDPNLDITIKRAIVKDAFLWHKSAGTVSALKKYMATISENISLQEWYDYGGQPYHFRIEAMVEQDQEISADLIRYIAKQIYKLKNARSILDEAVIVKCFEESSKQGIAAASAHIIEQNIGVYEHSSLSANSETLVTTNSPDEIVCDSNDNIYVL